MKDIQAYLFINYYAPHLEMDEETILYYLNKKQVMPIVITKREMELMRNAKPSTKHLCHALKAEGFSVGWIANYLKVPQPNVSYHLKTAPKQEWLHPTWEAIRLYQERHNLNF